jgi:hypothetical protein
MVVILDFIYYVVDQINTDVRPNIFNHCKLHFTCNCAYRIPIINFLLAFVFSSRKRVYKNVYQL